VRDEIDRLALAAAVGEDRAMPPLIASFSFARRLP
jgi:hypothetical protein